MAPWVAVIDVWSWIVALPSRFMLLNFFLRSYNSSFVILLPIRNTFVLGASDRALV